MTYAETLQPEFDQEMANTRKVLERLPDDKLEWQARIRRLHFFCGFLHALPLVSPPEPSAYRRLHP